MNGQILVAEIRNGMVSRGSDRESLEVKNVKEENLYVAADTSTSPKANVIETYVVNDLSKSSHTIKINETNQKNEDKVPPQRKIVLSYIKGSNHFVSRYRKS